MAKPKIHVLPLDLGFD